MSASFGDPRLPERFWAKVELVPFSTCWYWVAAVNNKGYGISSIGQRRILSHRFAYEALVGSIPVGLELDHFRCDNTHCVNPDHLRPVTHRENILRSDAPTALNAAKTRCSRGHEYTKTDTRGYRRCACDKIHDQRKYARLRAEGGERWERAHRLRVAAKLRYRQRLREARQNATNR